MNPHAVSVGRIAFDPPNRAGQDYIATLGILSEVWSTPILTAQGWTRKCASTRDGHLTDAARPSCGIEQRGARHDADAARLTRFQLVAHDGNLVAQEIHHALVSVRYSESVCLFLELVEPRNQLCTIGCVADHDFVLKELKFTV